MKKIYTIDASNWLYRSYFAIQNITNLQGESTNALFGFIRTLNKLIKDFSPDYVVCVFDGPRGIEKRKKLYEGYKAKRQKMPADLRYQIEWAKEFCDLRGIAKLDVEGVEADDSMGSLAYQFANDETQVFLCTSDKDMAQLVNENVTILNTHKDNLLLDSNGVEKTYGVPPSQIIDYLAIVGDASDNIPGLPGFGSKTAISLLQKVGSLDALLNHPEVVPGKKKDVLIENTDLVKTSKQLVTIETDVQIPQDLEFYRLSKPDTEGLREFFIEKHFNSFLKELEDPIAQEPVNYQIVDSPEKLKELVKLLSKQKEICFDTETAPSDLIHSELVGIAFATSPKCAWYLPIENDVPVEVKDLFENPDINFFGHNVKQDCHTLWKAGIDVKNISFDIIIASYLLNSHLKQHSLDQLCLIYFGKIKTTIESVLGKGKQQKTMRSASVQSVSAFCAENVDYCWRLKEVLQKELKERGLETLFNTLEMPLLPILMRMEKAGIYLDEKVLKQMANDVNGLIKQLEDEIHLLAGEPFNINSPKQLGYILFEKLGIPALKKTSTGYSTNASVLEELNGQYPIVEKVLEYRTYEKLRSTYIESLPSAISPNDGRIHCTFNQWVTATGRLSCQNPNLQNIPVRSELGQKIRSAFRPEKKDWKFLAADYSQIELRLLAHLSEDPNLIQAFENDEDIHQFTASIIFQTPLENVTKLQRHHAKAVNFGVIYGQQAFGLSRELGISIDEAQKFIDTYFIRYPNVKEFISSCKEATKKSGKAFTLTGRERKIPEIDSHNSHMRQAAERLAINTPLQGSAADLIKKAMLAIDERVAKESLKGYMILQIHDELIFEIPQDEIETFHSLVKQEMESVWQLKVPLIVDVAIGNNWKEC